MKKLLIAAAAALLSGCASYEGHKSTVAGFEPELKKNEKKTAIALAGDVMLGRNVAHKILKYGPDYPFEFAAVYISGTAAAFCNLESPLIYEDKTTTLQKNGPKKIHFFGVSEAAKGIKNAGFTVVSLANNHTLDYRQNGVKQTLQILEENGIMWNGIEKGNLGVPNEPAIIETDEGTIGLLCYSGVSHWRSQATKTRWGTMPANINVMRRDIRNARKKADLIMVYLHWGLEGRSVRKAQREKGRQLIDAGADFVFGSHTHLFQDIEKYEGKFILYGLGNFVFDMKADNTKDTALVKVYLKDKKFDSIRLYPMRIENHRPVPVTDNAKARAFVEGLKLREITVDEIYRDIY